MKFLCLFLLLISLSNVGICQFDQLTVEHWELNGPVQSMEEHSFDASYKNNKLVIEKDAGVLLGPTVHTLQFNKKGFLTEFYEYHYTKEEGAAVKILYAYNDIDLLVRKEKFKTHYNPDPIDSTVYDNDGNILEKWSGDSVKLVRDAEVISVSDSSKNRNYIKNYRENELESEYEYIYHENGNIKTSEYHSINEGKLRYGTREFYDSLGRAVRYETFYRSNLQISSTKFVYYDSVGNIIENNTVYPMEDDGTMRSPNREKFQYDRENNLIQIEGFGTTGTIISTTKLIYDDENRLLNKSFFEHWGENLELSEEYTYNYNEDGNLFKSTHKFKFLSPEWFVTTKVYKYDEHDNWIKQVVLSSESDTYVVLREFKYYER